MRNFMQKYAGMMAGLALVITTLMANSTCVFTMHQDEMPETAKKLRKF